MHSFSLFATTSPSQSAFIIADTTSRRRCHKRRRRLPTPHASSSTINEREGKPIQPGQSYPAKEHCSNCGLCDSSLISYVKDACAFLGPGMSRIEKLEEKVHGKKRNIENRDLGEKRLFKIIGNDAGFIHTGRSRNDQVITDFKLWTKSSTKKLNTKLIIWYIEDLNRKYYFFNLY